MTLSCINYGFWRKSLRCNEEHSLKGGKSERRAGNDFWMLKLFPGSVQFFPRHRSAFVCISSHRSVLSTSVVDAIPSHLRVQPRVGGPGQLAWTSVSRHPLALSLAPAGHIARVFCSSRRLAHSKCERAVAYLCPNSGLRHGGARTRHDMLIVSQPGLDSFGSSVFNSVSALAFRWDH